MKLQYFSFCFNSLSARLFGGVMLLLSQAAHADVWGYIDERGIAHFSEQKLDERYEIFYLSSDSQPPVLARKAPVDGAVHASPPQTLPRRLMVFFEVSPEYKQVKHLLRQAANEYQIDYALLQALIATESGFDASAVSPKGAVGLMQIMPMTAMRYGLVNDRRASVEEKLADPRVNIHTGSRLLRDLLKMYPQRLDLVLAAYNAGEGAVQRAGNQVPNYKETIHYVKTILHLYAALKLPNLVAEQRHAQSRLRPQWPSGPVVTQSSVDSADSRFD